MLRNALRRGAPAVWARARAMGVSHPANGPCPKRDTRGRRLPHRAHPRLGFSPRPNQAHGSAGCDRKRRRARVITAASEARGIMIKGLLLARRSRREDVPLVTGPRKVSAHVTRLAAVVVALVLQSAAARTQLQVNQVFVPQGPAPKEGPFTSVYANDLPNGAGTATGAVQAILPDPALGANTMFLGSPNGGIWSTTNGGATWTPLTDKQASLSIASLALDANDPSGKTLIAGVGLTSNGSWGVGNPDGRGGLRTGLLYSTNAGNTWATLGGAALADQSVISAAARGSVIMAATFEPQAPGITQVGSNGPLYGLYRSVDNGQTFGRVTAGLPPGPVTALVADPS